MDPQEDAPRPLPVEFTQYRVVERVCDGCGAYVAFSSIVGRGGVEDEHDGDEPNEDEPNGSAADEDGADGDSGENQSDDEDNEDDDDDDYGECVFHRIDVDSDDDNNDNNSDDDGARRPDTFGCCHGAGRTWFMCRLCPDTDLCADCRDAHEHPEDVYAGPCHDPAGVCANCPVV
jgi:hypothetical protein